MRVGSGDGGGADGNRPKSGDVIAGKYRIERLLGEGGMGVVFAAWHVELGKSVAIKLMNEDALASTGARARFLREAQSAAALESEHAVRVLDVGTLDDGAPYIAMERLVGTDLAQVLRIVGPLPVPAAVRCILDACRALEEAHRRGIVHRDVKPSNLFVSRRFDGAERVVVLDFGISKAPEAASPSLTATTDALGSPLYMSPEQIKSMKGVDARTDVWALGAVLYELVTGEPPFSAPTLTALSVMIVNEEPRRPRSLREDLPEELEAVVLRCLRKDLTERYASVSHLVRDLQPFAEDAPLALLGAREHEGGDAPPDSRAATMPASPEESGGRDRTTAPRSRLASAAGDRSLPLLLLGTLAVGAAAALGVGLRNRTAAPSPAAVTASSPPKGCVVSGRRSYPSGQLFRRPQIASGHPEALITGFGRTGSEDAWWFANLTMPIGDSGAPIAFVFPGVAEAPNVRLVPAVTQGDVAVVGARTSAMRGEESSFVSLFFRDLERRPYVPRGGRNSARYRLREHAVASTTTQLIVVSTGTVLGEKDAPLHDEVRVASLYGKNAEVALFASDADSPAALPRQVAGASGRSRSAITFVAGSKLYASVVPPLVAEVVPPLIELATGTISDSAVIARGDELFVVWNQREGETRSLHYRRLPQGAADFGPRRTLPLGSPSSFAVAAKGDRLLLVWTDAERATTHFGSSTETLEDAAGQRSELVADGLVLGAALAEGGAWVLYGGATVNALSLSCAGW